MEIISLPSAFVNCVECFTARLLFEQILNQLYKHCPGPENEFSSYKKCDTFNEFVRFYKRAITSQGLENETVYIVLDKADILREMDANLVPGFLRLQELTGNNVTVIFLTEIAWETFRPNTGCLEPLTIYFADYSKAELQKILSSDHPEEYAAEFYASYINILLGIFYTVCRDIKELRHLAALNFAKFSEPVVRGEGVNDGFRLAFLHILDTADCEQPTSFATLRDDLPSFKSLRILSFVSIDISHIGAMIHVSPLGATALQVKETETHKLWRNIEPHLKKAMQTVYLREISSSQWEKMQQEDQEASQLKGDLCAIHFLQIRSDVGLSAHAHVELPYYSKFLLVAGYLASYNPARTDKRFFLKEERQLSQVSRQHPQTSSSISDPASPLPESPPLVASPQQQQQQQKRRQQKGHQDTSKERQRSQHSKESSTASGRKPEAENPQPGRKSVAKTKHKSCAICREDLPPTWDKRLCNTCIQQTVSENLPGFATDLKSLIKEQVEDTFSAGRPPHCAARAALTGGSLDSLGQQEDRGPLPVLRPVLGRADPLSPWCRHGLREIPLSRKRVNWIEPYKLSMETLYGARRPAGPNPGFQQTYPWSSDDQYQDKGNNGFLEGYRVNSHTCNPTLWTMSTACTATPYPHRALSRAMILAHKRAQKSGPASVPHPLAHQSLSVGGDEDVHQQVQDVFFGIRNNEVFFSGRRYTDEEGRLAPPPIAVPATGAILVSLVCALVSAHFFPATALQPAPSSCPRLALSAPSPLPFLIAGLLLSFLVQHPAHLMVPQASPGIVASSGASVRRTCSSTAWKLQDICCEYPYTAD
ncbi:unnamed protein product [Ranitomeya imitator]|uniref:Uncharacterized protein n=1 Tax=Ranitomeya imitator TaxID=111125 RepID=A0ABN9LIU7_9NEOB|nr:unnamed protein product [Ranitomeya imitator]